MLSGTACGLPLLYGDLAVVALAMDAFPRLTLPSLGAVPLLVTLPATHKTLAYPDPNGIQTSLNHTLNV